MNKWMFSTNHKNISLMYMILGFWSGMLGTSMSMLIRTELININNNFNNNNMYYSNITLHALIMIFFMTMPIIIGSTSNWLIPLMINSMDLIFPRMNNFSFWLLMPSLKLMIMNMLIMNNINTGWTLYPPLIIQNNLSINFIIFSLHLNGISSIMSSMNFIISMMFMKPKFFNMLNLNLFCWAIMITSILLILSVPVLASGITMIIFDYNLKTMFFNPEGNGNPIMFQHIFWFFGHPEVYILILPGFGIISQIINQETNKKKIFSKLNMIYAMSTISLLGFLVWSHHMFTIGIDINTQTYFMTTTMIIAIPTSIKIFSWLISMNGFKKNSVLIMWIYGFLSMFTIGGLTGIVLSNSIIDINLHDSYYVIAHFHYILSMGVIFSILTMTVFWLPLLNNSNINNNWMMINFMNIIMSTNLTFFPQHFLGLNGMPRRYIIFSEFLILWNNISSMGSLMTILFVFMFILLMMEMMMFKRKIMFIIKSNNNEWKLNKPINNHSNMESNFIFMK